MDDDQDDVDLANSIKLAIIHDSKRVSDNFQFHRERLNSYSTLNLGATFRSCFHGGQGSE